MGEEGEVPLNVERMEALREEIGGNLFSNPTSNMVIAAAGADRRLNKRALRNELGLVPVDMEGIPPAETPIVFIDPNKPDRIVVTNGETTLAEVIDLPDELVLAEIFTHEQPEQPSDENKSVGNYLSRRGKLAEETGGEDLEEVRKREEALLEDLVAEVAGDRGMSSQQEANLRSEALHAWTMYSGLKQQLSTNLPEEDALKDISRQIELMENGFIGADLNRQIRVERQRADMTDALSGEIPLFNTLAFQEQVASAA